MKFLFWNIKRNSISQLVSQIANGNNVDVVILAECADPSAVLTELNTGTKRLFHLMDSGQSRVTVYTRFPPQYVHLEHNERYLMIHRMDLPNRKEMLLGSIHFISKKHSNEDDQWGRISRISTKIREVENRAGHSRTVLVGDLNMNPFEKGMISANGLHAVMTQDIARKINRTINREPYSYFYNPMWGRFGDTTEGPSGTFYRGGSSMLEYFWHMYDQVLIRPALLDLFDHKSLQVLTEYKGTSFIRHSGVPEGARVSDHLPVLFALRI